VLLALLEPQLAIAGLVFTVATLTALTCSDNTAGNADSAAACNDKPGGTAGNVKLLEIFNRAASYCNPDSVGGPANRCYHKARLVHPVATLTVLSFALRALLAMLTALLHALTSLVALLAMSSFSKASPALQVIVTLTVLLALMERCLQ